MLSENRAELTRRFRDLGVVELKTPDSTARKRELVTALMELMAVVKHGPGQFIVADGITDGQKKHLNVHINKFHRGLRGRVKIDRDFRYYDGQRLRRGTLIEVQARSVKRAG